MARVEVKDRWFVDGDVGNVRDAVRTFCMVTGFKIVQEQGNEIRVKQGSQFLMRLLGGWFVSAATLPKAATVTVLLTEEGVLVRARIEETMGFGILDPLLADKYRGFFEEWMDNLARVTENSCRGSDRSTARAPGPSDERTTGRKDDRLRRHDPDPDR